MGAWESSSSSASHAVAAICVLQLRTLTRPEPPGLLLQGVDTRHRVELRHGCHVTHNRQLGARGRTGSRGCADVHLWTKSGLGAWQTGGPPASACDGIMEAAAGSRVDTLRGR